MLVGNFYVGEMNTLANNIKKFRKKKGWSQGKLAKLLKERTGEDWDQGRISNYELGKREPKSSYVASIATALSVTEADLREEHTENFKIKSQKLIPLIEWSELSRCDDIFDRSTYAQRYVSCPEPHSAKTLALVVSGESMSPEFKPGDLLFVDFSLLMTNGSCVIAADLEGSNSVLREIIVDGTNIYLKALNPQWPSPITKIELETTKILGVVIGSYRSRS